MTKDNNNTNYNKNFLLPLIKSTQLIIGNEIYDGHYICKKCNEQYKMEYHRNINIECEINWLNLWNGLSNKQSHMEKETNNLIKQLRLCKNGNQYCIQCVKIISF